jgi:hypothetical protein
MWAASPDALYAPQFSPKIPTDSNQTSGEVYLSEFALFLKSQPTPYFGYRELKFESEPDFVHNPPRFSELPRIVSVSKNLPTRFPVASHRKPQPASFLPIALSTV